MRKKENLINNTTPEFPLYAHTQPYGREFNYENEKHNVHDIIVVEHNIIIIIIYYQNITIIIHAIYVMNLPILNHFGTFLAASPDATPAPPTAPPPPPLLLPLFLAADWDLDPGW